MHTEKIKPYWHNNHKIKPHGHRLPTFLRSEATMFALLAGMGGWAQGTFKGNNTSLDATFCWRSSQRFFLENGCVANHDSPVLGGLVFTTSHSQRTPPFMLPQLAEVIWEPTLATTLVHSYFRCSVSWLILMTGLDGGMQDAYGLDMSNIFKKAPVVRIRQAHKK